MVADAAQDSQALLLQMQAQLSELTNRQQIHEVYVHYGRGIDRLDEAADRSAFWPDAQINYGTSESITPQEH